MKAMIFAAGLGTRLKPQTNYKPKALVEINGRPLLEILLSKLANQGIKEVIVNVHHFADAVKDYLKNYHSKDLRIEISDESELLLDTGGGLKKAEWFFKDDQPVLLHNVDILSTLNFQEMLNVHQQTQALATLAVRNRQTSRYLGFDGSNQLCSWTNRKTGELIEVNKCIDTRWLAFSGIHIISHEFFQKIKSKGVFSIIEVYLELARDNKVIAFPHDDTQWLDVGTHESVLQAEVLIKNGQTFDK